MSQSATYIPETQLQFQTEESVTEPLTLLRERRVMEAFLAGDDEAFADLFDRHHERLYLYAARMTGDSQGAEDVMQEVWERLIRLRSNPQEVQNPIGLLLTMTRNLSLNFLKKEERKRKVVEEAGRYQQGDVADHGERELRDMIVDGLNRLPMKYREVLLLNIYSGYGFEEIAGILGITTEAAWKRASRGRKELREIILHQVSGDSSKPLPDKG